MMEHRNGPQIIAGIEAFIIMIVALFLIADMKDPTTAKILSGAVVALVLAYLRILKTSKVQSEIRTVDQKAEIAATTTEGIPPTIEPATSTPAERKNGVFP